MSSLHNMFWFYPIIIGQSQKLLKARVVSRKSIFSFGQLNKAFLCNKPIPLVDDFHSSEKIIKKLFKHESVRTSASYRRPIVPNRARQMSRQMEIFNPRVRQELSSPVLLILDNLAVRPSVLPPQVFKNIFSNNPTVKAQILPESHLIPLSQYAHLHQAARPR